MFYFFSCCFQKLPPVICLYMCFLVFVLEFFQLPECLLSFNTFQKVSVIISLNSICILSPFLVFLVSVYWSTKWCPTFLFLLRFRSFSLIIFLYYLHCIVSIILPLRLLNFPSTFESIYDFKIFRCIIELQNLLFAFLMMSTSLSISAYEPWPLFLPLSPYVHIYNGCVEDIGKSDIWALS